ncbi:MAG: hypothetical protein R6X16_12885, partial [Anaerolineae bacterium]
MWNELVWGLIPAGMILLAHSRRLEKFWPLTDYAATYQKLASGIVAALLWLWLIRSSFGNPGNADPLPFIPLLNPLELSQIAVLLLLIWWLLRHWDAAELPKELLPALGAGTAFLWLNTALAR